MLKGESVDYLALLKAEASNRPEGEPAKGSKGAFEGFEGSASGHIAAGLGDGLRLLRVMSPPRITLPQVWPEIVSDAVRLAEEGWAAKALALAWKPLELFGCCGAAGGEPRQAGLAVWMAGRRILLLDALSCVVEDGAGRAVFYSRAVAPGGVFLWELNDGR